MIIATVEKKYNYDGRFECYLVTYSDDDRITCVPHNDNNIEYQQILEWVANGGIIVDNGA